MSVNIRSMKPEDGSTIMEIYDQGLATGMASFQTSAPPFEDWDKAHLTCCRIVAEVDGQIVGWIALSPTSSRFVYRGVTEVSLYIADCYRGMGIGSLLMGRMIDESEAAGIWTLQSSVFCDNTASIKLQEKHGFRILGKRERIAFDERIGKWRDTYYMERRSRSVGQ